MGVAHDRRDYPVHSFDTVAHSQRISVQDARMSAGRRSIPIATKLRDRLIIDSHQYLDQHPTWNIRLPLSDAEWLRLEASPEWERLKELRLDRDAPATPAVSLEAIIEFTRAFREVCDGRKTPGCLDCCFRLFCYTPPAGWSDELVATTVGLVDQRYWDEDARTWMRTNTAHHDDLYRRNAAEHTQSHPKAPDT